MCEDRVGTWAGEQGAWAISSSLPCRHDQDWGPALSSVGTRSPRGSVILGVSAAASLFPGFLCPYLFVFLPFTAW